MKWKSFSKNHLLFVVICGDYRHYAEEAILLDDTYRVCKYAIPLYFLVVKSNINF